MTFSKTMLRRAGEEVKAILRRNRKTVAKHLRSAADSFDANDLDQAAFWLNELGAKIIVKVYKSSGAAAKLVKKLSHIVPSDARPGERR